MATSPTGPRLSARVLLVDARDRVLLLRTSLPDGRTIWLTPGGGVEPGETPEAAAVRELHEETGVRLASAGRCVWTRYSEFSGLAQDELFFFARVIDTPEVLTAENPVYAELETLLEHRWWTQQEIVAAGDDLLFAPRGLGRHLAPLLAGEVPAEPFDVGI